MATPQPLIEAGLEVEYEDDGAKLVVRDVRSDFCPIRNRGGEALAQLLMANRHIKALDISKAGISDNGVSHICLAIRQTDQLESLALSPVGLAGLEFLLGVLRRCTRLTSLTISLVDVDTLVAAAQNVTAQDHDVTGYTGPPKGEGDEEEEEAAGDDDDEEEPGAKERKKLEKLRKILNENDYDSGDEGASKKRGSSKGGASQDPSATLLLRLSELVEAVRQKPNLTHVSCSGDSVPEDITREIDRAVMDHCELQERRARAKEERGARTAFDALRDQMAELGGSVEAATTALDQALPGEEDAARDPTRLGIRAFVGRRLFAALGEALFECQRFKSKENEAVADWQGETAFLAMYVRELAQKANGPGGMAATASVAGN